MIYNKVLFDSCDLRMSSKGVLRIFLTNAILATLQIPYLRGFQMNIANKTGS